MWILHHDNVLSITQFLTDNEDSSGVLATVLTGFSSNLTFNCFQRYNPLYGHIHLIEGNHFLVEVNKKMGVLL